MSEEEKREGEKRSGEFNKIFGTERCKGRNKESDYEECYWEGFGRGYAEGRAAATEKTYIRGL